MSILRNPELKGILLLVAVIAVLATVLAAMTGKLEKWVNIPLLSGPRITDRIVFVSGSRSAGEVYSMKLDGSDRRRLTNGARAVSGPAISPAGNRIVYIGMEQSAPQVFTIGARGGKARRITGSSVAKSQPSYSPDGSKLTFIAAGKVYVAELNGDNLDPVLPSHEELHSAMTDRAKLPTYSHYAWAPGGNSMVGVTRRPDDNDVLMFLPELEEQTRPLIGVVGGEDGPKMLVTFSAGDENPTPLTRVGSAGRLRINGFSWAKEAQVLAVSLTVEKTSAIVMFDAEQGKTQPVLAVQGQSFGAPAMSPDGASLAIPASYDGGKRSGLLVIDAQSEEGPGILCEGTFTDVSYSPAGDRLLATRVDGGRRDIVMIDPSTGEITELTTDGRSGRAVWSPPSEK